MSQKSYQNENSTAYLVPTPIGNMDDITYRAIETLKNVKVIFSEDTRVTSILLNHFNIKTKLISSNNYTEEIVSKSMLEYLRKGENIAIVSDRGTPIISDPGYKAVKEILNSGYNVVSLPGATALIPALVVSGIEPYPFLFYGFLNSKSSKRIKELENLKEFKYTMIFYEAPHRIKETLNNIKNVFGNRIISISREISKKFEEIYRGTIEQVLLEVSERGEYVIVVEGNKKENDYNNLTIEEHVRLYLKDGVKEMDAIKSVAKKRNIPKSDVYKEYQKEAKK